VLVFHSAEHGIDEGAALTCAAVVLIAVAVRSAPKPPVVRVRFEPIAGLPPRSVVAAAPPATESPPGFTPLRL
jgi:hypothetical protein